MLSLPAFAQAASKFSDLLPFAPDDIGTRVSTLVAPFDLGAVGERLTPREAVEIWLAALNNSENHDSFAWVFVLVLLRSFLNTKHPMNRAVALELGKRTSLNGKPLRAGATWFEMTRRLAANLFHIGRLGQPTPEKQRVLREAILLFNLLLERDIASTQSRIGRTYLGMRGVARALLARSAPDSNVMYELASSDLEQSRRLGNDGVEASYYSVEVKIHLYDLDSKEQHLDSAETVLREVKYTTHRSRLLWFGAGEIGLRRGFAAAKQQQPQSALTHFKVALDAFRQADQCPADIHLPAEYLAMKRGHAAFKVYTARHECGLTPDLDLLDAAIGDLRVGSETLPAALILRSMQRRKQLRYVDALNDLQEAFRLSEQEAASDSSIALLNRTRCLAGLAECSIQIGLEQRDAQMVEEACERRLKVPDDARELNVAALVYGARFLLEVDQQKHADLARRVAFRIRARISKLNLSGPEHRFEASHAATLLLRANAGSPDEHSLRVAYQLQRSAIELEGDLPPAELLGYTGQTALQLGKCLLLGGGRDVALGFFADAALHFESAAEAARTRGCSEEFSFAVAHSRAGEAYVRAHALSALDEHAEKAVFHLTTAQQLGNATPQVIGLLGDVAYRKGRKTRDAVELRRALELKAQAKARGGNSRENRSVSAAAAVALWNISADVSWLTRAIEAAIEAIEADGTWPWPLVQLAELALLPDQFRSEAVEPLLSTAVASNYVRMVRFGRSEELYKIACRLAVEGREFERAEFGSRQPVYVLDDPHGLLESSIVFKETSADSARREFDATNAFGKYLVASNSPASLLLPEPLLILPRKAGEVVYAMRRARGEQLGRVAIQAASSAETSLSYNRALDFLARYHAWRLAQKPPLTYSRRAYEHLVGGAFRFWTLAGFKPELLNELRAKVTAVIPVGIPAMPKKDAHPENWLVDENQNIVMLDLEASGSCPLIFELVQLIDDYPWLPVDERGWSERIALCKRYLQELAILGVDLTAWEHNVPKLYAVFALLRISFGLSRNRARHARASSSAVRAGAIRDSHYEELLAFIGHDSAPEVRKLAKLIQGSVAETRTAEAVV